MNHHSKIWLEIRQLECYRDQRMLFSGLDFKVSSGELVVLEGSNGSGKTTLLRILCGLRRSDQGYIQWHGSHPSLAYIGHHDANKKELTVWENLQFWQTMRAGAGSEHLLQALEQVQLSGFEDNPVQSLSAGQKRRLSLARLLVAPCWLWVLDEPFTALDRSGVALVQNLMLQQIAQGGAVIMTSHHDLSLHFPSIQYISLSS